MLSDRELIIDLEFALCTKLRPTFLSISDPDEEGEIVVVIACTAFNHKTIQERITIIFKLISDYVPLIIEEHLVVVQAYNNSEMEEVLDDIFSREIF